MPPSSFLTLPLELRHQIYHYHLSLHKDSPHPYPNFHAAYLPLLLTCRTIHAELLPLLTRNIDYTFPSLSSLMDYFSKRGKEWWGEVRFVTVEDYNGIGLLGETYSREGGGFDGGCCVFSTAEVMVLWEGLALERFAVHFEAGGGEREERRVKGVVRALVERGKGWRYLEVRVKGIREGMRGDLGELRVREGEEGGRVDHFVQCSKGRADTVARVWREKGVVYKQDCQTEDEVERKLVGIWRKEGRRGIAWRAFAAEVG